MRGLFSTTVGIALALVASADGWAADDNVFRCEPALPFYCGNIHIGCAGRSKLPTEPFDLTLEPPDAVVTLSDGETMRTPVVFSFRKEDAVMIFRDDRDWIRIEPDGVYSQRIYRKGGALMTRGVCGPVKP